MNTLLMVKYDGAQETGTYADDGYRRAGAGNTGARLTGYLFGTPGAAAARDEPGDSTIPDPERQSALRSHD